MVDYGFSLLTFEYFLLVLVRLASFIFVAPIFSQRGVPNRIKVGIAVILSIIVVNTVDKPTLDYQSVIGYAIVVLCEGITGLVIGFAANICSSIVFFAGHIIDMDIGMSMATIFNQETNSEETISGNYYYYFLMLLLVSSNFHVYILRAICDSFQVVPIGGATFEWEHLLATMIRYMGDMFIIGFRIFLPVFACIMILNCVLGIMAKVAPQMNMFSVGIQLKLIVGLLVMFFTAFMLPNIADFLFVEIKEMVVSIIEGLY